MYIVREIIKNDGNRVYKTEFKHLVSAVDFTRRLRVEDHETIELVNEDEDDCMPVNMLELLKEENENE